MVAHMNTKKRIRTTLACSALLALGLAACGDDSDSSDSSDAGNPAGATVVVELGEWDFVPSVESVSAGVVTLEAMNGGGEVHELVLFKTDLAPEDLPVDKEGSVDESGDGLELIDEVENVKPGETKSFTVELAAGNYVMACNLIENGQRHFMNGMYRVFTVRE